MTADCNQVFGRCQRGCDCAAYERYMESDRYEEDQRLATLALQEPADEVPPATRPRKNDCPRCGADTSDLEGLCRICQGEANDAARDAYYELDMP